jgi:hypothetical protein
MDIIQCEDTCRIIFHLKDIVLKAQCYDIYDCGLVKRIRATYRNRIVLEDDDPVDTVYLYLESSVGAKTLVRIIRYARLILYHSE